MEFSRLFSMAAFEALRHLRRYSTRHPDVAVEELVSVIQSVEENASSFDFSAAIALHEIVVPDASHNDGLAFYQSCVAAVIQIQRPVWTRVITQGRYHLSKQLTVDERQCFRAAGLLEDPPSMEAVKWWDTMSGTFRLFGDQEKLERARRAEALSIEFERRRLKGLGIEREPVWVAIDNNWAGYDILSYDPGSVEPTNRLVEVKSTIASPARFVLTRNEWKTAQNAEQSYRIHVWNLLVDPPQLFEKTVAEVAPHIPSDSGNGRWATVEVPLT